VKVILKTCRVGAGWCQNPGEIIEVTEKEAVQLMNAGHAQALPDEPKIETATTPTTALETATAKATAKPKPQPKVEAK
jgi:hypothetical protein